MASCRKFVSVFIDSLYLNASPANPNENPKQINILKNKTISPTEIFSIGRLPKTNDIVKNVKMTLEATQIRLTIIRDTKEEK